MTSAFNFYSFVLFPSLFGTGALDHFVRTNYLGGIYLFGVGSSMAPMAIFVFSVGRQRALSTYAVISAITAAAVILGCNWLVIAPWSYLCLVGALCIHASGFFSAFLIQDGKFIRVIAAQSVQPVLFASAISLESLHVLPAYDWSWLYLVSGAVSLGIFLLVSNLHEIGRTLAIAPAAPVKWLSIALRVACCVSFPVFFQLELVLCGRFSSADVAVYSMVQKLYASIPIALSGSIAVYWLASHMKSGTKTRGSLNLESLGLAAACSLCVPLIGFAVLFLARGGRGLTSSLILLSAGAAFLFTASSFTNLSLIALRPLRGLHVFAISLSVYLLLFGLWRPKTDAGFLILAAVFFASFLVLAQLEKRAQSSNSFASRNRLAMTSPGRFGMLGRDQ